MRFTRISVAVGVTNSGASKPPWASGESYRVGTYIKALRVHREFKNENAKGPRQVIDKVTHPSSNFINSSLMDFLMPGRQVPVH